MNRQQQTALNMVRFIKSQSLTLLEKLDALDADEQAAMCERLHELAEELQNSIQTHFEAQYGPAQPYSCWRTRPRPGRERIRNHTSPPGQ